MIVSSVPPVPPEVLDKVAKTPFGQEYSAWENESFNIPQMITALVVIEQSPAGKAWGVELAAIPSGTKAPSDARYSEGSSRPITLRTEAQVEWFFRRSNLTESAPMANISWHYTTENTGINFSCNAVRRMLYAAQELIDNKKDQRLASLENKFAELERRMDSMSLELKQATANPQNHTPTVTCLMLLFVGYMPRFACSTCNYLPTDNDAGSISSDTAQKSHAQSTSFPSFDIAPHTDRLTDLNLDAKNWFLQQLDTRKIWVRATDPDSNDNHISWSKFPGAVEMDKSVAFSHGNHRFW